MQHTSVEKHNSAWLVVWQPVPNQPARELLWVAVQSVSDAVAETQKRIAALRDTSAAPDAPAASATQVGFGSTLSQAALTRDCMRSLHHRLDWPQGWHHAVHGMTSQPFCARWAQR